MNVARTKEEWLAARKQLLDLVPKGRDETGEAMAGSRGGNMTGDGPGHTRRPLGLAAAGALLAVLVPKCPICLAAYLSFLGAAASYVVWLRPIGVVLTVAGVALAVWRAASRLRPSRWRRSCGERWLAARR